MEPKKMKEVFEAIVAFIDDIWEVYGNKKKADSLALYHRLTEHIKFKDLKKMERAITGFQDFFSKYDKLVLGNELESIPRGTHIKYGDSDRVYLDIQKFIYQADRSTREAIRQHLMTISVILEPNKEKMEQLEQKIQDLELDSDTPEGEFLNGIMGKARETMETMDAENPAAAVMGMFSSGIIGDMMSGLEQGMSTGEMDMGKMLGALQTTIGKMIPEGANLGSTSTTTTPEGVTITHTTQVTKKESPSLQKQNVKIEEVTEIPEESSSLPIEDIDE